MEATCSRRALRTSAGVPRGPSRSEPPMHLDGVCSTIICATTMTAREAGSTAPAAGGPAGTSCCALQRAGGGGGVRRAAAGTA
jgi:hypothetical protein